MEPDQVGTTRREDAARRVAERSERVAGGLVELEQWLLDQVRGGLAGLERAGYGHFDAIAARMVDAQAPGVANLLRALPGELAREGWPGRVLEQLAALHLLVRAHQGLAALPLDLAATVRSRIGYPVAKRDVLAGSGVLDDWTVLGLVDTVEYRLETRRVWLHGAATGRWAVYLSFAPPGGQLDASVLPGQRFRGSLHFYPGSGQHRALVGARDEGRVPEARPTAVTLTEATRQFAELLAADPWASRMPVVLAVVPMPPTTGHPWRLRESSGQVVDVVDDNWDGWPLLARSRGGEVAVFGEWQPQAFWPLSVLGSLPSSEGAVAA